MTESQLNLNRDLLLKFIMFAAVIAATVLAQAEVRLPRPEVTVRATSDVTDGQPIRLIDIASVDFVLPAVADQALQVEMADGAHEGHAIEFKNADLIRLIRSRFAESPDLASLKWTFFIPQTVKLNPRKIVISPMRAENQIQAALHTKCNDCKVAIKDLRVPVSHDLAPLQNCQMQMESLKMGGTFLLPVQCESGSQSKTYWISGSALISKVAPVATRQILPGDRIASKDFQMRETDLTFAKDGVPSEAELNGQIAGRLISLNAPIFKNDLRKEVAIQRGQNVRAVMGSDTFEVSSAAIAEENGFVGDTVRIRSVDTQKVLSGIVVERGVVRLQ